MIDKISNRVLLIGIFSSLLGYTLTLFIKPSIYSTPNARAIVCQYDETDIANSGKYRGEGEPYISCANDGRLKIVKAELITTDQHLCPLQYIYDNEVFTCESKRYINKEITEVLTQICKHEKECKFNWHQLPKLKCVENDHQIYTVDKNNQAINMTYSCSKKRPQFRPFSNKRYSYKFSRKLFHPLRKLSHNRLERLPGPARLPVPVPVPVPARRETIVQEVRVPEPYPVRVPVPVSYPKQKPYPQPVQQYNPQYSKPKAQYSPSKVQYNQPQAPYYPPKAPYNPPKAPYNPPKVQYSPPKVQYNPPKAQYSQPQAPYNPPKVQYSQPKAQYTQQPQEYAQPKVQYTPSQTDYTEKSIVSENPY